MLLFVWPICLFRSPGTTEQRRPVLCTPPGIISNVSPAIVFEVSPTLETVDQVMTFSSHLLPFRLTLATWRGSNSTLVPRHMIPYSVNQSLGSSFCMTRCPGWEEFVHFTPFHWSLKMPPRNMFVIDLSFSLKASQRRGRCALCALFLNFP